MRIPTRPVIIGILCLFVALAYVDEPYAFTWEPENGVSNWESSNVLEIRESEFVTLVGSNPRVFTISLAGNGSREPATVKITARSMDVGAAIGCGLMSGKSQIEYHEQSLVSGRTWRDYVFEFDNSRHSSHADRITFFFKHVRTADISGISVNEPSLADFFIVQGLKHHEVNFFEPYRIFGYPFAVWCYLLFGLFVAGVAVCHLRGKRKFPLLPSAVLFLTLIIAYDLRNSYEQAVVMTKTYRDFISPPLDDKRFFWCNDMIGFGEFIGSQLPENAGDIHYFGDDITFLYFRYLLYPHKLIHARDSAAGYNIVYGQDNVALSNDGLIVGGKVVAAGGRAVSFSPASFIYVR